MDNGRASSRNWRLVQEASFTSVPANRIPFATMRTVSPASTLPIAHCAYQRTQSRPNATVIGRYSAIFSDLRLIGTDLAEKDNWSFVCTETANLRPLVKSSIRYPLLWAISVNVHVAARSTFIIIFITD